MHVSGSSLVLILALENSHDSSKMLLTRLRRACEQYKVLTRACDPHVRILNVRGI